MKKWLIRTLILAIVIAGIWGGVHVSGSQQQAEVRTTPVVAGPLTLTVTATGNLAPTTEVLVGSEISGTVGEILVKHNDRVRKGQLLSSLRPELYRAEHEQALAELARAKASLQQLKVQEAEAKRQLERVRELNQQRAASEEELEVRKSMFLTAEANRKAGEAAVSGAQSRTELTEYRLERCEIRSPIDGVVLDCKIDVGQTVAATLMTPELFVLAEHLSRMELLADVSEADVGYVCPGQRAVFRVNAFKERQFEGVVREIRNQPRTIGNVVTYTVVVDVDNDQQLLRPGMPADIDIELIREDEVAKISNASLRFRPPLPPDQVRTLLEGMTWPERPKPLSVIPESRPAQVADTIQIEPPPIPPTQATLWSFSADGWKPIPVWTGFTDNRETALLGTGPLEVGDQVVVEVRGDESSLTDQFEKAVLMADPSNRRL